MAKTDWGMNDSVQPSDMNQIGQEINQLRVDVDNIEVPHASTIQAGIVQLSNAVNSTAQNMAATPAAVKQAYDQAEAAFQLGNERKQEVVDVLIAKGISASTSESWDSLIEKLSSIIKATGTAAVGDVLATKTFSNANANGLTGTMPDRGTVNATLTQQGQEYTIPSGRHSGSGKVAANIANLTAANVRNGASVGGVAGTFSQFSNGATAAQILTGRSAAVNGATVNGSMANRTGFVTGQSVSRNGTTIRIRPQAGYYPGDTGNGVQFSDPNFVAGNIRRGVTLFGLAGSMTSTPIYDTGTQYVPFEVMLGSGIIQNQAQDLYMTPTGYGNLYAVSSSTIDFTGYTSLIVIWRSVDQFTSFGMYVNPSNTSAGGAVASWSPSGASSSYTAGAAYLGVSGLSGSFYIQFYLGSNTSGGHTKIYIRKILLA